MRIASLGTLIGPVIAYGGALGNFSALGALIREISRAAIPPERVISTGNIAGTCAHPAECVAATRAYRHQVVAGNIERQLASGAGEPGWGYPPGSLAVRRALAGWRLADRRIDAGARDWMEGLPDLLLFAHAGRRWAVVHGGATRVSRFLWPVSPEVEFEAEINAIEAAAGPVDGVIAGHCGIAFERVVNGVHWLNPGNIGLPPNDGRRGGRYARLDEDGARLLRLEYDPSAAFAAMVSTGLSQGYDLALMTGRWPSEEMLPPEMRTPV
ncbi:MAG: metallophosphoesterase [Alphaproteobacteria bacterium]|nr:MAG: metallophosphoesterase [Alphaproteobacteria bacterium]